MPAVPCACPTIDPVACIRRRYPGTKWGVADDEFCTCVCHDVAQEEEGDGRDYDCDDDCNDNPVPVDVALSRLLDADPGGWAVFIGTRDDD